MDNFSIFFNMEVCCVFSLESPHQGDSNKYIQYTNFNIKKKIIQNYPRSAAMGFCAKGLKNELETVVKRAISLRATEVLLYMRITNYLRTRAPLSGAIYARGGF